MNRFRFSLARLIAVIAIFAASMAAFRTALSYGGVVRDLTAGLGLMVVALMLGIERWALGSRDNRPFWGGFVAVGAIAPISILLVACGKLAIIADLWEAYVGWLELFLTRWPTLGLIIQGQKTLQAAALSLYLFFPQLCLAIAGGTMVQLAARCWPAGPSRKCLHTRLSTVSTPSTASVGRREASSPPHR